MRGGKFKDAEFMKAEEKEKVLSDWKRFLESGFDYRFFTERLYKHLTLHCSFIAHYDREGFYHTYFSKPEDAKRFLRQFDKRFGLKSAEYGGTWWIENSEYQDINEAMVRAFENRKGEIYRMLGER
jgi:hypothetical protein